MHMLKQESIMKSFVSFIPCGTSSIFRSLSMSNFWIASLLRDSRRITREGSLIIHGSMKFWQSCPMSAHCDEPRSRSQVERIFYDNPGSQSSAGWRYGGSYWKSVLDPTAIGWRGERL